MIVNDVFGNYIVEAIHLSEWDFYLTGSRFFGTVTTSSDYDFFVKDMIVVRDFLFELGFEDIQKDYKYCDSSIVGVLRHESGVDVQLIENELMCRMKNAIQNTALDMKDYPPRNKSSNRFWWQKRLTYAYAIYHLCRGN